MSYPTRTQYEPVARAAAAQYRVNQDIFVRQIDQESGFGYLDQCNSSGACGIAQIVPYWHPGVDVFDPVASLYYAASLDRNSLDRYGGNYCMMLAAYNTGAYNLETYGLPFILSEAWAGGQTLHYVQAILGGIMNCFDNPADPGGVVLQDPPSSGPLGGGLLPIVFGLGLLYAGARGLGRVVHP